MTTKSDLTKAYLLYRELLSLAENCFVAGDVPAAAALCEVAAYDGFRSRSLFVSPTLENLLLRIGRTIPNNDSALPANEGHMGKRRVLHVLTHARPVGGDCRFAWRWIERDLDNQHSVVITNQEAVAGIHEIPQILIDATQLSGGKIETLHGSATKPLERASELRKLCQGADLVVLHLFPYDVIPVLALAAGCESTKTLLINHADHTFWVGSSVAHLVVHMRTQPPAFLQKRRGLDVRHSALLPIPLHQSSQPYTKEEAKRMLGYSADTILLLTIATPFKYSAPGFTGFLDLVTPVLIQHPDVVLVAVGANPTGPWQQASQATNKRIVAKGICWDTDVFYAAADVYLDSIPFASITSLLEAGSRGVPLLGLRPASPEISLLGPSAPGLDGAMELAETESEYCELLAKLIQDASFRQQSGQRVADRIFQAHAGPEWKEYLQAVYAKVDATSERKSLVATSESPDVDAMNNALLCLYKSVPYNVRSSIRHHLGPLPYRSRLPLTFRLFQAGFPMCWLNLLPPPFDTIAHSSARWIKRFVERQVRQHPPASKK